MRRLRCRDCGVVYEVHVQHVALLSGSWCRRCGGELEPVTRRRDAARPPAPIVAVRSAVTGRERLPFG